MDEFSDGKAIFVEPQNVQWSEVHDPTNWLPLNKIEILDLYEQYHDRPFSLILAVGDKLKEKNHVD